MANGSAEAGNVSENPPGVAKARLTELSTTDFDGWAKESFQAAIAVGYQGGAPDHIAIARRAADRRMILAGYRLVDLLTQVVGQ